MACAFGDGLISVDQQGHGMLPNVCPCFCRSWDGAWENLRSALAACLERSEAEFLSLTMPLSLPLM